MARFRILNISDLHLCLRPSRQNILGLFRKPKSTALQMLFGRSLLLAPSSYDPDLAEAVAEFAYARRDIYDLVLLTGDIATTGLDEDLEPAFEFVDMAAAQAWLTSGRRPTLRGTGKRIFLLPGNHDRYRDDSGSAGGTRFDAIFQRYWWNTNECVQRIVIPKGSDNERLALIATDFCLKKNSDAQFPRVRNRYGRGRAYSSRVKRLMDVTIQTRKEYEKVVVIWVMHFPPAQGVPSKLQLIDAARVRAAAIKCDVPLIIAGHVHNPQVFSFQNVKIWCAGSATAVDAGQGNWVHMLDFEVSDGNLIDFTRTNYCWDQSQQDFV